MKPSIKIITGFAMLLVVTITCRFIPMPKDVYGFTPVYALMVFSGIVFRNDKKLAITLPLIAVFISDIIYEFLYNAGQSDVWGFYKFQLLNYALYAVTTCVGFFVKKINAVNVAITGVVAPTLFYILSNFSVWATSNYYPKTFAGLGQCYIAGLPFYFPWSLVSTVLYSGVLFGVFYGVRNFAGKKVAASR